MRSLEKRPIFILFPLSCLVPSLKAEQSEHQHKNDREDQKRRHRKPLVAQIPEIIVHKMLEHVDALVRARPAQKVRLPEGFEGIDDRNDKDEKEGGHEERQGDVLHDLEGVRPFAGGCFPVFPGNGAQPRQEKDEVVAAVFPDVQADEDRKGMRRLDPVFSGQAEAGKQTVYNPRLRKERLHHNDHRGRRQHQRAEKEGAEKADPLKFLKQKQRQQEGNRHQ